MTHLYNDTDRNANAWLAEIIKNHLLPDGDINEGSISEITPDEVSGYTQCHFFSGIGGWPYALQLAGWPEDMPIWTGSCPCQPYSVAGKKQGDNDTRHLWPDLFRLIKANRPPVVMGEQVAGKLGYAWFDGVCADLEGEGYTCRAVDIPSCAVNAPHIRNRLYWIAMANTDSQRLKECFREKPNGQEQLRTPNLDDMADSNSIGQQEGKRDMQDAGYGKVFATTYDSFWDNWVPVTSKLDGKTRRAEPTIPLLVDGLSGRVALMRGYGNAIVPPLAAQVIRAFMESLR
ncbi:DNA cytosine methyltransferase [Entomobacter blattae]|uniref:DNA (cytosine-5-)-methyltransferase n=1 Tax=Entomobacter blattae TaxID=2762277 RepID=A0A7H1NU07_9PROT|nr:DNA cytosine methyltransferase [Entomobacter blattae]QNT79267.1 C-5 cytosine-specific DNA methylase [Entomobacter blattae]